ncbi:GNAT family N-acetyltransferase [Isachenkonia alkalipeptolytica]|uniref:GNAT family N-acetyltransferase n=1 Tax=Isachenkonia alkalipeptolytica TaxID=2565777 RepID=A0AA43XIT2_9CLOT|nr:GNAT family N-acetyltransferase [Isachenkonia alkalipeptolytica]NBG87051.1 GNAT family N-acetyltransferase [Isachenkonia alkalipeptolytica]
MEETLRQGIYEDKEQILEISKTVWERNDFILRTVDSWLDPESGKILVVEKDGEIRAFAKMSYLTKIDYWLEGLRVKEAYRGRGYANLLTGELIQEAKKTNPRSLRFACHRKAVGSIRSGEKHGFLRKAELNFILCEKLPRVKPEIRISLLSKDQNPYEKLREFPQFYRHHGFLFGSKWKFLPAEERILKKLHREGKILVTEEEKDLLVYDHDSDDLRLLFYAGGREGVKQLILALGEKEPGKLIKTMTLPKSEYNPIFQELGFHMKGEREVELPPNVYLYEYPL